MQGRSKKSLPSGRKASSWEEDALELRCKVLNRQETASQQQVNSDKKKKERKESLKANSIILLQLSTYGQFCFFIPHTHLSKYVGIYFLNEDLNFLIFILN